MKALVCSLFSFWLVFFTTSCQSQTTTRVTTTETVISRAELDQMLAPIALYPDTVLSHILIAATYPLEVVQADRWAQANRHLRDEDAVNAVDLEDWDPSVKALVAFPDLLSRMSDDLDWTQRLGDAFLADEGRVMDAIQNLRDKAYASGNLRDTEYVRVVREKKIIIIEPAVERVVYIPYYDTREVYGSWWWDRYPPVYWRHPVSSVHIGGFYWGPRTYLSTGFFFSSTHWHQRRVVVIDHHHHNPHYYSGRKIAHYQGARHWEHNPRHRRNIAYRHDHVRHKYDNHSSHRADGGRFERDWRSDNRRRDDNDRQHRDQNNGRDRDKRDSGVVHGNRGMPRNSDASRNHTDHRNSVDRRNDGQAQRDDHRGDPKWRGNSNGERETRFGNQNRNQDNGKRAEQVRERLGHDRERNGQSQGERENRSGWRNGDKQPNSGAQPNNQHRPDMNDRREHLQRVQPQNPQRAERREQLEPRRQEQVTAPRPQRQESPQRQEPPPRRAEQPQQRQEPQQPREERRNDWAQRGERTNRNVDAPRSQPRQEQSPRNDHSQPRGERRFER